MVESWLGNCTFHLLSHQNEPDRTVQNVHAIGDRANKAVLDVFESIAHDSGDDAALVKRRTRIEHSQIMREEDLARSGKLGSTSTPLRHSVRLAHLITS